MRWIILEECFKDIEIDGEMVQVYLGKIEIPENELLEKLTDIKNDTKDVMKYKKYKEVLKKEGFDIE